MVKAAASEPAIVVAAMAVFVMGMVLPREAFTDVARGSPGAHPVFRDEDLPRYIAHVFVLARPEC
jgi:hypothetical protein